MQHEAQRAAQVPAGNCRFGFSQLGEAGRPWSWSWQHHLEIEATGTICDVFPGIFDYQRVYDICFRKFFRVYNYIILYNYI